MRLYDTNLKKQEKTRLGPEDAALLALVSPMIYKESTLEFPIKLDLNKFLDKAITNKVLYPALKSILLNNSPFNLKNHSSLDQLLKKEKNKIDKYRATVEMLNDILGDGNYLLINTYKGYNYATHDVDIFVKDIKYTEQCLRDSKFHLIKELLPGIHYIRRDSLLVDIFDYVSWWGSMTVMDNNFLWKNSRRVIIDGEKSHIPNIEADIMSNIGHMNYQMYEIMIGDMMYMFSLLPHAKLSLISQQVKLHNWELAFINTIYKLDQVHRFLYDDSIQFENGLRLTSKSIDFPMTFPLQYQPSEIVKVLNERGLIKLVKLPSYVGIKLRETSPALHKAYCKVVLDYLSKIFVRYIPW